VRRRLGEVGLWDLDPANLFRICWKNEPSAQGGGFGGVNHIELPPSLTGVPARIVMLVGKWFPTGAHKVGAAFGCLVPRLVTGRFDPTRHQAVWPSTGNFCRGGAYDSSLLGCDSVAILPEGMSRERFEWLEGVAGRVIRTPGSESNVKEIFDECARLEASGEGVVIFNQFEDMGNYLWHHEVTGAAMAELAGELTDDPGRRLRAVVLASGSGGTLAAGDAIKELWPRVRMGVCEPLQCPTLLLNGYGKHRIEGVGDKHVPWLHNVRNTDVVLGVDDSLVLELARLFNEDAGREHLAATGVAADTLDRLGLLGLSSLANMIGAIKYARYFELGFEDVVFSVATDSMDMYGSRLEELEAQRGAYTALDAATARGRLAAVATDWVCELGYRDRKRLHNLKYYTWVEQQGKAVEELEAQWYDENWWSGVAAQGSEVDALIDEFNRRTGLLGES
jgi:cysteine synthase